jgi:hypothetical protein
MNPTQTTTASICTPGDRSAFECSDVPNRLPVKVDVGGSAWLDGKPLLCPPVFPASSRGELVFRSMDAGVLLGPWGPDPEQHLILSCRVLNRQDRLLRLTLEGGRCLDVWLSGQFNTELKPRQRIWLSIALSVLQYHR